MTSFEARNACRSMSFTLATIASAAEQKAAEKSLGNIDTNMSTVRFVWTGLLVTQITFVWTGLLVTQITREAGVTEWQNAETSTQLAYTNFIMNVGEPKPHGEDCVLMSSQHNFQWIVSKCNAGRGNQAICASGKDTATTSTTAIALITPTQNSGNSCTCVITPLGIACLLDFSSGSVLFAVRHCYGPHSATPAPQVPATI